MEQISFTDFFLRDDYAAKQSGNPIKAHQAIARECQIGTDAVGCFCPNLEGSRYFNSRSLNFNENQSHFCARQKLINPQQP